MKERVISFETAKLAKEKGFPFEDNYNLSWYNKTGDLNWVSFPGDESLYDYFYETVFLKNGELYNGYNETPDNPIVRYEGDLYLAPTQSILQKWLREVHDIHADVIKKKGLGFDAIVRDMNKDGDFSIAYQKSDHLWEYEEALEHILKESLKLIS